MRKLSDIHVNPIPIVGAAVVIAAALGYFFFIRPNQAQATLEKTWNTPEAAEARRDGKPKDEAKEQMLQQLRVKEGMNPAVRHVRRRDRE